MLQRLVGQTPLLLLLTWLALLAGPASALAQAAVAPEETPAAAPIAPAASAAEPPLLELDAVVVSQLQDPAGARWDRVLKALDAYAAHRSLAPNAPARFVLTRLPQQEDPNEADLALRLATRDGSVPVDLAPDHSFTVQREWVATDDAQARLIANRTRAQYRLSSDIRSAGVPAGTRRLGDLRLACEVNWALVRDDLSLLRRALALSLGGPCSSRWSTIGFRSPNAVSAVTLWAGDRRLTLPAGSVRANGWAYVVPLHDRSWPDDTRVEFTAAESN